VTALVWVYEQILLIYISHFFFIIWWFFWLFCIIFCQQFYTWFTSTFSW